MTTLKNTALAVAMMALAAPFAVASHLDQIAGHARELESEAREISNMLRSKTPDLSQVNAKADVLEKHAASVRASIAEFESASTNLNARQSAELERMKVAAHVVEIFVANKKNILAGADATRQRSLLKAKADGIALRAASVAQSATKLRT